MSEQKQAPPEEPEVVPGQTRLFEDDAVHKAWEHWKGMPEYVSEDISPWRSVTVHFRNVADLEAFGALVQQPIRAKTKSIWYPEAKWSDSASYRYAGKDDDE